MRRKFAMYAALAAMLAWGLQARPLNGVGNQKKTKAEQEAALKEQKARAAAENELVKKVRDAINSEQWQKAADLSKQLIAMQPAVWIYQIKLGDMQYMLERFDDALETYEKALKLARGQLNTNTPNPYPPGTAFYIGAVLIDEGDIYLKQKNYKLAVARYQKAADVSTLSADAQFNLCAAQYNMGIGEGALDACEKAISADTKRADAYFIKGSVLIGKSKKDSVGKLIPAPGAVEALKKYLELAPTGTHAADVKAMLETAGVK